MTRIATLLVVFLFSLPTLAQDADGDGVLGSLELSGYRWNLEMELFEPCTPGTDVPCFVTDPLSWSSDGDPYSDGQEASGVNMDSRIRDPYNSPIVAAYPVIEVALDSYSFTPLITIYESEGGSISEANSFTYEVETTESSSVTAGAEASIPNGVSASIDVTESFSETVSYSSTQTSGVEFNWESAYTLETGNAAGLTLSVSMGNRGNATAIEVAPRFNVYLGADLIATVNPVEDDAITVLNPGDTTPPFIPAGAADIILSFGQLQALQLGAPVTIEVVEVSANIVRWRPEDSNWACGEFGDVSCSWDNFQSQILPRTLRLLMDFGYSGDPAAELPPSFQRNPYEFRVFTGSPFSNPDQTLRDVLRAIAEDNPSDNNGQGEFDDDDQIVETSGDDLMVGGRAYPGDWLLVAQANASGFNPVLEAWRSAGEPDDLLDVVMPTEGTLLMASPDPIDPGPVVTTTTFTKDLLAIRAAASPKGSLPVVAAEAHVVQYGGTTRVVPMTRSPDGTFWTTEDTTAAPFLLPAGAESSYVVFTDLSGASRQTTEPLGFPLSTEPLPTACDEVPEVDQRPNAIASGFDATIFRDGDLDVPVEVFCGRFDEFYWRPQRDFPDMEGPQLVTVEFATERTSVAGGSVLVRSTDGGRTWADLEIVGEGEFIEHIARSPETGTLIAVGSSDDTQWIIRSTDDGLTWTARPLDVAGALYSASYAGANVWHAAGYGVEEGAPSVYISTDDGLTWTTNLNAPPRVGRFYTVAFRDAQTGILVDFGLVGGPSRAWRTTDGGQTWINVITAVGIRDVTYAGDDTWYAVQQFEVEGERNVLRSRQNGGADSWEALPINDYLPSVQTTMHSIDFVTPTLGFVAVSSRVLRTEDGGDTWIYEDRIPGTVGVRDVAAYDANRALTVGENIINLTTSGGGFPAPVPVANESGEPESVPTAFSLDSAYPNPFRDQATIAYTLGAAGDVSLAVYDVLGRRVASLVDEAKAAGAHTVPFDGRSLASGVYVIRLLVGDRAETRRMTLLR